VTTPFLQAALSEEKTRFEGLITALRREGEERYEDVRKRLNSAQESATEQQTRRSKLEEQVQLLEVRGRLATGLPHVSSNVTLEHQGVCVLYWLSDLRDSQS
jgi:hypothetical protein